MPEKEQRRSGIEVVGDLEWGAHICNFYDTKEDLLELLVPYFKAGLESNEFCLWITSDPLNADEATDALRKAIPNFEQYLSDYNIEIIPAAEWFFSNGAFDAEKAINGWHDKLGRARAMGFSGMRVNGNESWLDKKAWEEFVCYEKSLNESITDKHIIIMCTFPKSKCTKTIAEDVGRVHDCSLLKHNGEWEKYKIPEIKTEKGYMVQNKAVDIEQLVAERTKMLTATNKELRKVIAEQRGADEAAMSSEANLKTILHHIDIACILLDNGLNLVSYNEKAAAFISTEFNTTIEKGAAIVNYYPESERTLMTARLRDAQRGQQVNYEIGYPQVGRNTNWYQIRMSPVTGNNGRVINIMLSISDITYRKHVEDEIKASEERYKYLFNNNPSCIILYELDTLRVLEANDTTLWEYGYTREEMLQRSIFDLKPRDEWETLKELMNESRTHPYFDTTVISRHIKKSGSLMYMNIAFHRISYKGQPVLMSMATNVTDKVILEQKLSEERYRKQHQITAAVITAEEKGRQEIGRELHDNVNQILAASRLYLNMGKKLETMETHPNLDETDTLIHTAINEIRSLSHSLVSPFLSNSGLNAALDYLISLTGKSSQLVIQRELTGFDEHSVPQNLKLAMYRIIQEQLNNIVKHSKATTVTIKFMQRADQVILSIKDNGIGFDPSKSDNGIGLLNIRTRASLFNGEMSVISAPGNGCILIVAFEVVHEIAA